MNQYANGIKDMIYFEFPLPACIFMRTFALMEEPKYGLQWVVGPYMILKDPFLLVVCHLCCLIIVLQSFGDLVHKPLLVDLTVEEGQRLKVIYGSCAGFHAVDVDSGSVYDIYLPTHVSNWRSCCIVLQFSLILLISVDKFILLIYLCFFVCFSCIIELTLLDVR